MDNAKPMHGTQLFRSMVVHLVFGWCVCFWFLGCIVISIGKSEELEFG